MGKVVLGITISLDGFINDRNGDVGALYRDFEALHETGALKDVIASTGAVVMGRKSYEMGNGDYTGYEFQVPLFVVTHNAPGEVAKGENDDLRFHFVTDGVESAIARAKEAAGDKNVVIVGGASVAQQSIKARLVDELHLDIMPIILGDGLRFFENLDGEQIELERARDPEATSASRTTIQYRFVKP